MTDDDRTPWETEHKVDRCELRDLLPHPRALIEDEDRRWAAMEATFDDLVSRQVFRLPRTDRVGGRGAAA